MSVFDPVTRAFNRLMERGIFSGDLGRDIDRLWGLVSPESELRRMRARAMSTALGRRAYEGASTSRRTSGWTAAGQSADAASQAGLSTLRNRARDLVRNNPWAESGIRAVAAEVVGTGIIPQAKTKAKKRVALFEDLWRQWGDTQACDAAETLDFYGLQNLIARGVAADGEMLVRRVTRTPMRYSKVPLQLQVLEADYLDTNRDGVASNGNRIIQGIEVDSYGRRVAYYLFPEHPGANSYLRKGWESKRVDAADILHVFRLDRPGQLRGVPWLAPSILRLRDLDDYEDAQLVRQKIAACFTAFVHDSEGETDTGAESNATENLGALQPGAIEILPPGKEIKFADPPSADGYGEHTRSVLRSIAASLGVTYEVLTGDYSQVNFSSGRMGWLKMQRNVQVWQNQMLVPQLCRPVWQWFVEACELASLAAGPIEATWTPPRREMIDPAKETEGLVAQVRAGLKSLPEAVREGGRDFDTVLEENAEAFKLLDAAGVALDSDPRQKKGAAAAPEKPAKPGEEPVSA